jgi:hypothetical protein
MARPASAALWDEWRQRVQRQRESGLSIVEFCRNEHVSSHRFHVWKRRLRQATSSQHGADTISIGRRSRKRPTSLRSSPRRHPTRAQPALSTLRRIDAAGFLQLPVTAVRPSPWIELALPDGTVVRLPQQNLAAVVTVLRVLRGEQAKLSVREDGCA